MTIVLSLLAIGALIAVTLLFRWWFSGGDGRLFYDSSADHSASAFEFSAAKYSALARLLDQGELRSIPRSYAMPSDVMLRLQSGRRELLEWYLAELKQDFQRAQWLRAQAEATRFVASPSAVRGMAAAWWRFRSMHSAMLRKARRGNLSFDELGPLLKEVQARFDSLAGV